MDRRTLMLGAGAGFIAIGGYQLLRPGPQDLPLVPMGAANAQTAEAADPAITGDMVLGAPDAPVEVIEYASFTCPHCATFHTNVLPQLKADYIDSGQVRFVHREVYFDRFGLWAGLMSRCAGPERYFGIIEMVYGQQRQWTQGSPAEVAEGLRRIGRTVGMSNDQLDACLSDAVTAQALLDRYEVNMDEHDISGTPAFVIDGELYSNMSYADMSAIIDERLAAQ